MSPGPRSRDFDTTHWSIVSEVRSDDAAAARRALANLYGTYWEPICARVRERVRDPDEAQDLTQAFFVSLIERGQLKTVRAEKGRLRSFLLAALRHFLLNAARDGKRIKRGGAHTTVALELTNSDGAGVPEPRHTETPERIFDRSRANEIINRAVQQLQREWSEAGDGAAFEALKPSLLGQPHDGGYRELGRELGLSEDATKEAVRRLRARCRHLIEKEIAKTAPTRDGIDAEIRYLARAFRR